MATAKDKASHRRQSRAIAPARVAVQDGAIVVVVPDVLGKNEAHRRSGHHMHTSTALKRYRKSVIDGLGEARILGRVVGIMQMATIGAWRLEVIGVWPTKRDNVDGKPAEFLMPCGDADAAIPQALDALQHAGILDDDARVVEVRAWNLYRRGVRATIMRLVRVRLTMGGMLERDEAIAHLLSLVPPAVEPLPKTASRQARRLQKARSRP